MEPTPIGEQLHQAWNIAAELTEAIERVRMLHRFVSAPGRDDGTCGHCGYEWPCPSTSAVNLYRREGPS